jgi:hypothetical protein
MPKREFDPSLNAAPQSSRGADRPVTVQADFKSNRLVQKEPISDRTSNQSPCPSNRSPECGASAAGNALRHARDLRATFHAVAISMALCVNKIGTDPARRALRAGTGKCHLCKECWWCTQSAENQSPSFLFLVSGKNRGIVGKRGVNFRTQRPFNAVIMRLTLQKRRTAKQAK